MCPGKCFTGTIGRLKDTSYRMDNAAANVYHDLGETVGRLSSRFGTESLVPTFDTFCLSVTFTNENCFHLELELWPLRVLWRS
jgi:hypothetical protein